MRIQPILTLFLAALCSSPALIAQQAEYQRVLNPVGSEQALIGHVVAIEGTTAVVGAPVQEYSPSGWLEGEVRVLELTSTGWELTQVLHPDNLTNGAMFGRTLALDGDRLAVGAELWGGILAGPTQQWGRVYLFERIAGTWTLVQEIEPPDPHPQLLFGTGLGLDGGRLAISSHLYDVGGFPTHPNGAIWVYEQAPSGSFVLRSEILPPPYSVALAWNSFAHDIDLDEDRIAVASGSGITAGAAFTYTCNAGVWSLEQVFERPGGALGERNFGQSLSLDGELLAIGEPWANGSSIGGNGRVYLYHLEPTGWVYDEYVHAPNPQALDRFGYATHLRGDRLLVGAPYYDSSGLDQGSSFTYRQVPGQGWQLDQTFLAEAPSLDSNRMGEAVAIDPISGWALTGAPHYWDFGPDERTGSALFHTLDLGSVHCGGLPNSTGHVADLAVIGSPDPTEQRLTLAAHHLPANVFAIHVMGPAAAPTPLAFGQLCVGLPFHRLLPISHTGAEGRTVLDLDWSSPLVAQYLLPGSTWTFQLWYRDTVSGNGTANLTSAVTVAFD